MPHTIVPYGEHVEQHCALTPPSSSSAERLGTVALLHGGYWRAQFTRELMEPMAVALSALGWHVVNIEYRRVDAGGGWPAPRDDATTAIADIAQKIAAGRLPGPLILLGHSVGGQLAMLAAHTLGTASVAGVLALAPVTDVVTTYRDGLGDNAADALLAQWPGREEEAAADASPLYALPIGVPMVIVHGEDDQRVPHSHTTAFASAAEAAGDAVRVVSPATLEHRTVIDPDGEQWTTVLAAIRELGGSPPCSS
ncbi:alpha/beta hydrolase [Microbacterium paraoxydans]|uniref:alpha/beta hydrolase n=1 Tax=Microbacterium paraoxydans TaxID=199592 RepID=UPI001CFAFFCA|nr:alpha/beta hydrolase [Microbacterium paraoxydans]